MHAGHAIEKIVEVAAVVGKILNFALHEERAETVFSGFDEGSDVLHFDGFRLRADLKGEVGLCVDGDINAGLTLHRFESGSLDRQAVLTRVQIDDAKESGVIGGGGLLLSGPDILRPHDGSGDSRTTGIGNRAGNVSSDFLGEKRKADDEASQKENGYTTQKTVRTPSCPLVACSCETRPAVKRLAEMVDANYAFSQDNCDKKCVD